MPVALVRIVCLALLGLLVLAAPPAQACYSGLVNIPTADLVEPGQYGLELQLDGALRGGGADTRILNTELGLGPRCEAGLDFDLSEEADTWALLNAKYLLAAGGPKRPAVALGVCGVGRSVTNMPYLVATQEFPDVRGHLGWARIDDQNRWFVGVDRALNDKLTLMADYTSGSDNVATVGAGYQFTDTFGVMAGVVFPNASEEDTGFTIHFVLNGPYRHAAKEQ
jgi:hypothetical protein